MPASVAFRRSDVAASYHDGVLDLLDENHAVATRLEGTARRLWDLMEYPATVASVTDALAAEYGAERSVIEADVRAGIEHLRARGLVDEVAPPSLHEQQRDRYLALLKRALVNLLYPEMELGFRMFHDGEPLPAERRERSRELRDIRTRRPDLFTTLVDGKHDGRLLNVYTHTMVGLRRLDNIERCAERIFSDAIAGDFLEAGVCRGGASIFMRALQVAHRQGERRVWAADSFEGLPPSSAAPDVEAGLDLTEATNPWVAADVGTVREHFRRYGLLDHGVRFLQGWFADTLPHAPVERLAILRLDCDLYGSTREVLEHLYDRVVPGGFVIIDDYAAFDVCRRAVDEFRERQGIDEPLRRIDWTAYAWRRKG